MDRKFCDLDQQAQYAVAEFLLSKTGLTRSFCETFLRIDLYPHEQFYCIRESVTLTAILRLDNIDQMLRREVIVRGKLGKHLDAINEYLAFFERKELESVATWHSEAYQSSESGRRCRVWVLDTVHPKWFDQYSEAAFSEKLFSARCELKRAPGYDIQDTASFRQSFDRTFSDRFFVYRKNGQRKILLAKDVASFKFCDSFLRFLETMPSSNGLLGVKMANFFLAMIASGLQAYTDKQPAFDIPDCFETRFRLKLDTHQEFSKLYQEFQNQGSAINPS
ncbi:MAG: hypothetical protein COV52_01545 [Gammaproteobacteria bacterium CG11_big_fil_rev_8_21_14_0_20_46_22]|nr:MAG: hypothetical protein COW05_05020 [Gammaproteobacteria bacterium CG12_big_fil_rev_8_21_14_0_65_46_12]PIR11939.1 MAG: hypothetical protein COV52_01545 [Gammaproteobacteria bacterium CG11_big_fil_rev_8_21_14_0_20_46_22]